MDDMPAPITDQQVLDALPVVSGLKLIIVKVRFPEEEKFRTVLHTLDPDRAAKVIRDNYVSTWPERKRWEPEVDIETFELDRELY